MYHKLLLNYCLTYSGILGPKGLKGQFLVCYVWPPLVVKDGNTSDSGTG